jgi:hypothetical protein
MVCCPCARQTKIRLHPSCVVFLCLVSAVSASLWGCCGCIDGCCNIFPLHVRLMISPDERVLDDVGCLLGE